MTIITSNMILGLRSDDLQQELAFLDLLRSCRCGDQHPNLPHEIYSNAYSDWISPIIEIAADIFEIQSELPISVDDQQQWQNAIADDFFELISEYEQKWPRFPNRHWRKLLSTPDYGSNRNTLKRMVIVHADQWLRLLILEL